MQRKKWSRLGVYIALFAMVRSGDFSAQNGGCPGVGVDFAFARHGMQTTD
jgi:hypothetical protein